MAIDNSLISIEDLSDDSFGEEKDIDTIEVGDDTEETGTTKNTADSQNSERKAFMAEIELSLIANGSSTEIMSDRIQQIIVSHDYEGKSLPTIIIAISVTSETYQQLQENRYNGKMYLNIKYIDAYSETSLPQQYIKGQFSYFLSSTSPNYHEELDKSSSNDDSNYSTIHIGLMVSKSINELHKAYDGVLKEINQNTLIAMAVDGLDIVMSPLKFNVKYDTLLLVPTTSRTRFIEYIYKMDPFFDTDYLFFMDFDTSYLLDRTGTAISANDGTLDDVIFDIKSVTTEEAYYDGMEIKNGSYYVYVNPADTNVSINQNTEKVANVLVGLSENGCERLELDINRDSDSDEKITFQRTDNAILYKNIIESSALTIEIVKANIDSRYFSPNKAYHISNYTGYEEYNGDYLLMYKHEVISGKAGEFIVSTAVGLKKVGNINDIGNSVEANGANKSRTSSTARYATSASRRSVGGSVRQK